MKTNVIPALVFLRVAAYADHCTPQESTNDSAQSNRSADLSQKGVDRIVKEAHHELVMLPFYGVRPSCTVLPSVHEQFKWTLPQVWI